MSAKIFWTLLNWNLNPRAISFMPAKPPFRNPGFDVALRSNLRQNRTTDLCLGVLKVRTARPSKEFLKFCMHEGFLVPETSHFGICRPGGLSSWWNQKPKHWYEGGLIFVNFGMSSQETLRDFGIYQNVNLDQLQKRKVLHGSWF